MSRDALAVGGHDPDVCGRHVLVPGLVPSPEAISTVSGSSHITVGWVSQRLLYMGE